MDNNEWGNNSQNGWGGQSNNQNQWVQPSQNNGNSWGQPSQNNWGGYSQGGQNQWANSPQHSQNNWGQPQQNQWNQPQSNQWGTPIQNAWGQPPQKKKMSVGKIVLIVIGILLGLGILGTVGLGLLTYSVVSNVVESTPDEKTSGYYDTYDEDDEENDDVNLYSLFKGTWDLNLFTGAEGPTDISAMSVRLNKDGTFRMDYAEGDDYVEGTYTVKALNKDTNFDYAAEYFEIEMKLEDGSLNGQDVTTGSAEYEVVLLNDRKSTKFKDNSDIDGSFWMNTRSYNMYWSGNSSVEDILDNHSLSNMDLD